MRWANPGTWHTYTDMPLAWCNSPRPCPAWNPDSYATMTFPESVIKGLRGLLKTIYSIRLLHILGVSAKAKLCLQFLPWDLPKLLHLSGFLHIPTSALVFLSLSISHFLLIPCLWYRSVVPDFSRLCGLLFWLRTPAFSPAPSITLDHPSTSPWQDQEER